MQQNNGRGSDQPSPEDPTASMERTTAGRWAAPPASVARSKPSPRPAPAASAPEVDPNLASAPPIAQNPAQPGAPSAESNGRWVPDPTVQLTRRGPDDVPPTPEPGTDEAVEWGGDNHGGPTNGYEQSYVPNGIDQANGYEQMNGPYGLPGAEPPNGGGHGDLNGLPMGFNGDNGYDDGQYGVPGGFDDPWTPDTSHPSSNLHQFDSGQINGIGEAPTDFFDRSGYDERGVIGPGSGAAPSTGAFDVVDGLGPGGPAGPYGPSNGFQDSTGPSPYAADDGFGDDGFGDDDFGGSDPIDAIDNAGRNFDEEELETGMAARRNAIEWAVVLVAAVLLALVLRAVLLQAFYIPSPSMEDTLLVDDRVLVNKLSYRLNDISRGDIVVFHRTEAEIAASGPNDPKDVIKRVIATEGERIEIRDNQVLIDEQLLVEPYLDPNVSMADFGPQVVPEGHIFVMGDNRNLSSDSRGETGPVPEERVVGRAFFLFWPLNRLTAL